MLKSLGLETGLLMYLYSDLIWPSRRPSTSDMELRSKLTELQNGTINKIDVGNPTLDELVSEFEDINDDYCLSLGVKLCCDGDTVIVLTSGTVFDERGFIERLQNEIGREVSVEFNLFINA